MQECTHVFLIITLVCVICCPHGYFTWYCTTLIKRANYGKLSKIALLQQFHQKFINFREAHFGVTGIQKKRRERHTHREGGLNMHYPYAYLNILLFPNLASYQSMAVDTQYGYNGVDTMNQTSLTNGLGVLTSSIARHKVCNDTCIHVNIHVQEESQSDPHFSQIQPVYIMSGIGPGKFPICNSALYVNIQVYQDNGFVFLELYIHLPIPTRKQRWL